MELDGISQLVAVTATYQHMAQVAASQVNDESVREALDATNLVVDKLFELVTELADELRD